MCQLTDYKSKALRRFKVLDSTYDVCLPFDVGRNLTLNNRGRLKIKFGDWLRLTHDQLNEMKESEINKLFKLRIVRT